MKRFDHLLMHVSYFSTSTIEQFTIKYLSSKLLSPSKHSLDNTAVSQRNNSFHIGRSFIADHLWIYKRQADTRVRVDSGNVNTRRDANGWPTITSPSLMMCITVVRARQRDERNRRRPVVPRIDRRVHKSSGIPRALIIPLVRLRHRGTQITAASVINPSAILLGKF